MLGVNAADSKTDVKEGEHGEETRQRNEITAKQEIQLSNPSHPADWC